MTTKQRHSGVELLRVLLMLMIAMHHIIVHGLGLATEAIATSTPRPLLLIELMYNSILVIAVNAFVLISGYWGIRFRTKGFLKLLLQGTCYSVAIYAIFTANDIHGPKYPWQYWFLMAYLALYMIADYINSAVEHMSNKDVLMLTITAILIQCGLGYIVGTDNVIGSGYSLTQMICMYIIGRCLHRHVDTLSTIKTSRIILVFAVLYAVQFSRELLTMQYYDYTLSWRLFQYNNPLVMANATIIVLIFLRIKSNIKFVNIISPYVFGVYLLHDNEFIRINIIKAFIPKLINNWLFAIFQIPLFAFGILVVGLFVDVIVSTVIRAMLNTKITDSILTKASEIRGRVLP